MNLPSNLFIRGPAASGKSRLALERFLASPGAWLIVPTTTMAEHMRHRLAREGLPVRPRSIRTIAQLIDGAPVLGRAPAPLLTFLVEQALDRLSVPRWEAVASLPGFHRALAELVEEAPLAGLPGDWGRLLAEVDRALSARGLARRNVRLDSAAASFIHGIDTLPCPSIVIDGFFSFSRGETDLILALARRVPVTVTLPDSPSATTAIARLSAGLGKTLSTASKARRKPDAAQFSAATMEHETAEIARRILEEAEQGRPLREIGIVLRAREPYAAVLETALARAGIPARLYFTDPQAAHPAIAFLSGVVRAMLRGWDHELLLSALRMPISGLGATPEGDQLDFEWRARMPAFGLPRGQHPIFAQLAALDPLRREILPASDWPPRLRDVAHALLRAAPALVPADQVAREQISAWRSTETALAAFDEALEAATTALTAPGRSGLAPFWRQVETVLALEPLRVADRRRDVVHVMDVFEARQWELPVVFVCGMTERHFPQYHSEDPLLGDGERRRLGLDTAAERQQQERFLFDLATTRATEKLILSYPRFDEKGEQTLPSFFLPQGTAGWQPAADCQSASGRRRVDNPPQVDNLPYMKEQLADKHRTLTPSALSSFLQCPFQFFASKTLRLRERPLAPRDRLDYRLQGNVIHRVLAEYGRAPLLGPALFGQIFEEECDRARVPQTYRREAVRLEMLRNFEGFLADRTVELSGWDARFEQSFQFALPGGPAIRGRIDRLEVDARRRALVIDYKYSAANRIRDQVEESAEGNQVQAGLYLAAAERTFGLAPAGMLFCGLKKEVRWDGWHTAVAGLEPVGTSCTTDVLRDLVRNAESAAMDAHAKILEGRIEPAPTDPKKCRLCDYRDICRVESAAQAAGATVRTAESG